MNPALPFDLDAPLCVPVDEGVITDHATYDALDFDFTAPALQTTWRHILTSALLVGRLKCPR